MPSSFFVIILLLLCSYAGGMDMFECKDEYGKQCVGLRQNNLCDSTLINTRAIMRRNCAAACGYCTPAECEDLSEECAEYKDMGMCEDTQWSEFEEEIARRCRKTCGICREIYGCKNTLTERQCQELEEQDSCKKKPYLMSKQCPITCGFCHTNHREGDIPEITTEATGWDLWGRWSLCDVVCGNGVRYRSRTCLGGTCDGEILEAGVCTVTECPKAICQGEEETYCPFFEELGYCNSNASAEFMKEHCAVSCAECTQVDESSSSVVSQQYKLCVERMLDSVVSSSLEALPEFTVHNTSEVKTFQGTRLPVEAQDSLRKLSRKGRALTIQDKLFNEIVDKVNEKCGVQTQGTRGFIESKLMESKVITVEHLNCTESCSGDVGEAYRSINGTCNNCDNHLWGSNTRAIIRILEAEYEDNEKSLPRGWAQHVPGANVPATVPSPRLVSQMILNSKEKSSTKLTLMHFQWGQFLDHDITLVPTNPKSSAGGGDVNCEKECSNIDPCFPIQLDDADPLTNMTNGRRNCLPFTRSAGVKFDVKGAYPYINQFNEVSSYLDGSAIYGSSDFVGLLLKGKNGTLRTSRPCSKLDEGPMLPECPRTSDDVFCACDLEFCPEKFIAGDARVNEQPMLTVMHTLWVREHNRIVTKLREINPCWDFRKAFEETRKIVIAMLQHITYRLYLPTLLGPAGFKHYTGFDSKYDPQLEAGIFNSFSSAAFRFGHSQIPSTIPLCEKDWNFMETEQLHSTFFRAHMLCELGIDNMLRGLLNSPVNKVDMHFSKSVQTHLFAQDTHDVGLDLVSINVQRGRDHGIPPYTKYKKYCQEKYFTKAEFRDDAEIEERVKPVYKGDMDNLDLFVGGILEKPVNDGLLGPTFSCIIGEQFKNLRDGDRFFYTHPGVFKKDQLKEILKTSLSKVVCDNSKTIETVPRRAFIRQDKQTFLKCNKLPEVNLEKWRQCPQG